MDARKDFVPIVIDGQTWKICFDFNALASFQEAQGKNIAQALAGIDFEELAAGEDSDAAKAEKGLKLLENIDFRDLRAAWWCGLLRHHEGITVEAAGRLLHQGNFLQVIEHIGSAVKPFFPEAEDGDGSDPGPLDPSTSSASKRSPSSSSD